MSSRQAAGGPRLDAGRQVRYHRWGGREVLALEAQPVPTLRRGELLVATRAAALNPKDVLVRAGRFRRLSGPPPITPGFDFCGDVVDSRAPSAPVSPGDRVFGMLPGMRGGALASWIRVPAGQVARTPEGFDAATLAAVPLAALTALQALRDLGRLGPGRAVCINGASGGVGHFAIQIAARLGADVTTLSSERRRAFCRDLGAHCALSYDDLTALEGREFDLFFDVYGNHRAKSVRRWLASSGCYVTTVPKRRNITDHLLTILSLGRRARLVIVRHRDRDLAWIADELAAGTLRPVLDGVFPFDAVSDAFARLESRHAQGKVVVRIG